MNTDIERLLRQSIDNRTAGARVPAGLATRAVRRSASRRRFTAISAASAAAAVIAAGATTIVAVGGAGAAAHRQAAGHSGFTNAQLTSKIETALSAAGGKILVVTTHGTASAFGGKRPIIASWYYRDVTKSVKGLGHVFTAVRQVDRGGRTRMLLVDYRDRVWWQASWAATPARYAMNVCVGPADDEPGPGSAAWAPFVRSSLACGGLRVAGRTRIDGMSVIKIVGTKKDVDARFVPQTYYVDPVTYLPVRYVLPGAGYREFSWLSATPAHLRLLRLAVPAGFRRVPPSPH